MPVNWIEYKYKVNYFLLLLIVFFIPLEKKVISPLIILFFISSIINKKDNIIQQLDKNTLIIIGFYIIGLSSLLYGNNYQNTIFNNEIKLSLLIFPLSFIINKLDIKESFDKILKSFLDGTIVAICINIIIATIKYIYEGGVHHFLYSQFSYFTHVSYYSFYLCFSISILYYFWFFPTKKNYISPIVNFSLSTLFSLMILMASSKAGIISMFIIHLSAAFIWIYKYKKIRQGVILIFSFFMLGTSIFYMFPQITYRMEKMIDSLLSTDNTPNSSTKIRIVIWKESFELFKGKPLIGHGVGDVTDELIKKHSENGFHELEKRKPNCHNQFVQILIGSGAIGFVYFIFMLLIPYRKGLIPKQKMLYNLFLILILINFMTESMLETQAGIVFFSIFLTIFYSVLKTNKEIINKI